MNFGDQLGKKRLLVILGCMIAVIIVLGAIILYSGMSTEKTLAEQMILRPSDINETGWYGDKGVDTFPSTFENNISSEFWELMLGNEINVEISITVFNFTSQCQSEYSNHVTQFYPLDDNGTDAIDLGNGAEHGFKRNFVLSHSCNICFSVENVIVIMHFRTYGDQPWDEDLHDHEAISIAEVQFQKIVTILND